MDLIKRKIKILDPLIENVVMTIDIKLVSQQRFIRKNLAMVDSHVLVHNTLNLYIMKTLTHRWPSMYIGLYTFPGLNTDG